MRRFNSFLALLLVLLLPIQGSATVTNTLCHQPHSSHETQATHEGIYNCHQADMHNSHGDLQKEKNHCVSACGQFNIAALTINVFNELGQFTPIYVIDSFETYHSVLLPKFQRPPIQIS